MVVKDILEGKKTYLRQIELSDCTDQYVVWLNDPMVNRHLETRWSSQTMDSIKEFVKYQRDNDHSVLFAIIYKDDNKHIGNIKIGPINQYHHFADISYFIGEKQLWGQGIATEIISLVVDYGFNELKLHRIEAGAYANAVGSWKALEKNGFIRDGLYANRVISDGNYIDEYRYGLINKV